VDERRDRVGFAEKGASARVAETFEVLDAREVNEREDRRRGRGESPAETGEQVAFMRIELGAVPHAG
jgi:hypothetical protein